MNDQIDVDKGDIEKKDLESVPVAGRTLLFLRGVQRIVWGFSTLYLDFMVFSKAWTIEAESLEGSVFFLINLLVLTVLFGETAVKALLPVVLNFLVGKRALQDNQNK